MNKCTQQGILHCIFRVFAISHDPMCHAEDLFHMALTKLSERGSLATLGGSNQVFLAPLVEVASRAGIVLCGSKCIHH
jgi:hypothetical protein